MRLPDKSEVIYFLKNDFAKILRSGYEFEEAISRILDEYEYIANKDAGIKLAIYTEVFNMGTEKGFYFEKLKREIDSLCLNVNHFAAANKQLSKLITTR